MIETFGYFGTIIIINLVGVIPNILLIIIIILLIKMKKK